MKVLYIASSTGMAEGATKSLIAMISQVHTLGVELEVICPDENGITHWLKERDIKTHVVHFRHKRLPFTRTFSDKLKWLPRLIHDSWINFRAQPSVTDIAKTFSPDIIHENTSVIDLGYRASKAIGVPDVIHIREYGDLDFKMKLPGRKKRLTDKNVFTISITKDIKRHLCQDSNPNATQIYDGILQVSDIRFNECKEKWFLYAGRIERAKGIDNLLNSYVQYACRVDSAYPLYVCGGCNNPAYLEKMKAFVAENGLESKVVWMGERSDIADFMYRTAATIIPSRFEALGRVMPEAMANGSLCVAKYTGGTKEQLDNGLKFTGKPIAIGYEDNEQLTQALVNITDAAERGNAFAQGSEYRNMIDRSQRAVEDFFSEQSFGHKIIDFYTKILNQHKQSR